MTTGWGDLLSLLDRRADVLDAIVDSPAEKRSLVEELDVSRSTIDRAVRELRRLDLVDRTDDGVAITYLGRLAFASYVRYRSDVLRIERFSDVLQHLDPHAPLPPWVLEGAELHRPEPPAGHRPYVTARADVADATEIKAIASTVADPESPDRFEEALVENGAELELIGTPGVLGYLVETRDEALSRATREGLVTTYEHDDIPFGLYVFDPDTPDATVVVTVYDEKGQLAGMIRNRRDYVVDWAVSFFRRMREDADPVTTPAVEGRR